MKTPTLILVLIVITTTTFAGVASFLTQKKATWDFIQKTGGIEIVGFETKESTTILEIRYDVTGLTSVTRKPDTLNSGMIVKEIDSEFRNGSVFLQVVTSAPDNKQRKGITYDVEITTMTPGEYPVFYGNKADPEKKIGTITFE